jgi:predicted permease
VTISGVSTSQIISEKEIAIDSTTPLKAMIRKDLKLATRNIGSAFVFAIPIFLVVMLFPMIQNWKDGAGLLRSMTSLVAVEYANLFGGISLVSILMFDTQGASIHEGLPISSRLVLQSKTSIVLVPYILSMVAIDLIVLVNNPITPLILLIPIIQIPCGYIVGMAVGATIFRIRGGGRAVAVNVASDQAMGLLSGAVGALVGIAPLVAYGGVMLLTGLQIASLLSQAVIVTILAAVVWKYVPKLLKD